MCRPCVDGPPAYQSPWRAVDDCYWFAEAFDVWPLSARLNHTSLLWPRFGVGNRTMLPPSWQRRLFHTREKFHDWPDLPNNCDQVLLVYEYCSFQPRQPTRRPGTLAMYWSCPPVPARSLCSYPTCSLTCKIVLCNTREGSTDLWPVRGGRALLCT